MGSTFKFQHYFIYVDESEWYFKEYEVNLFSILQL